MRIVFLGINSFGQKVYDWLLQQGENVVAMLTTKEELTRVADLKPDLIISGGFRHILGPEVLSIPPMGSINFHKALLPYNRGANPNVWTIVEGTAAGVSIHLMDQGIDTGDILAQREVETSFADTGKTLYEKLERAQWELFLEFWPRFKSGDIQPRSQATRGTYRRMADLKRLRRLDPEQEYRSIDLLNLLRAMTYPPFSNCYVEVDGKRYFLRLEISEGQIDSTTRDESGLLRQYGEAEE